MTDPLMLVGADTTKTYTPASGASTVTDISNLPFSPGATIVKRSGGIERRYRFFLVEDLDVAAGDVVCFTTDDNGYEVTKDRSGGTSDNNQPAGLAVVAVTDGLFGWFQTYGPNDVAMTTDGSVAAGEIIKPHATTDGGIDSYAATEVEDVGFGQALDADTSTTQPVGTAFLNFPKG